MDLDDQTFYVAHDDFAAVHPIYNNNCKVSYFKFYAGCALDAKEVEK